MQDTIAKGTGNSRTLASVPNFLTLYPTYEAFAKALINRELPVDLGPLQAAGCQQIGTAYGKATVLPDSLCSALDLPATATPAQALEKIRALTAEAQGTAEGRMRWTTVSFTGTGSYNTQKTLTFPFIPRLLIFFFGSGSVVPRHPSRATEYPGELIIDYNSVGTEFSTSNGIGYNFSPDGYTRYNKKSADGKTFTWYGHAAYASNPSQVTAANQNTLDYAGQKYICFAIC